MKEKLRVEFENIIESKNYIFHFHTNWTDGKSSLDEYCSFAEKLGFRNLILLEHIRKNPSYNVEDLLKECNIIQERYGIKILTGFEAKILPDGTLDISDYALEKASVIGIAEHSFEGDCFSLANALMVAFENYSKLNVPIVWVHPGRKLLLYKDSNTLYLYKKVIRHALQNNLYIEINLKNNLPPKKFIETLEDIKTIIGMDAHSVNELEKLLKKERVF
jgi:histidinol phosphatase-like PHP family hydrolase